MKSPLMDVSHSAFTHHKQEEFMRRMILSVLLAGFVMLLVVPSAYAQRSEGRIFGTVVDSFGN